MLHFDLFGEKFPEPPTKKVLAIKTPVLSFSRFEPETKPVYIGENVYIRPNYIVSLPCYDKKRNFTTSKFLDNQKNLKQNEHKGKVSAKAQKEIKCAVNWLVASAKLKTVYHKPTAKTHAFKVNFITLTLPNTESQISEKDFKINLLNPFLTVMRKNYGLNNYIWKLELQKNGKLHVHLTTDSFIHWSDIRRLWNTRLSKCGYLVEFKAKFGHTNPNSTDVHAVYKVKDIAAYISKYMSKDESANELIKGKIWACNYELSRNCKPSIFIDRDSTHLQMRSLMNPKIKFKPIESQPNAFGKVSILGQIFLLKKINWLMDIKGLIKDVFVNNCYRIRNLIDTSPPLNTPDISDVLFHQGSTLYS